MSTRLCRWTTGIVAAFLLTAGLAAQPSPSDRLVNAPLTAGVVAQLFEHIKLPEVHTRIGDALRHADPGVRAAAARVIFMSGDRGRALALAEALAAETAVDPMIEMSRALTHLGDVSHDPLLFATWQRLGTNGAWKPAVAYGLARGPSALNAVARLRDADPGAYPLVTMIRAARPDRTTLLAYAEKAREAGDARLLGAALGAARELHVAVEDASLTAALGSAFPEVRSQAVVHLLSAWRQELVISPDLRAALQAVGPLGQEGDPVAALARELAQRAGGRAVSTAAEWNALVDAPPQEWRQVLRLAGARALLTEAERRRIARRLENTGLSREQDDDDDVEPSAGTTPVRLADGYPAGFLASVFAATGCDARRIGQDVVAAATVAFVGDGRTGRATTFDTGVPSGPCRDAVRVALRTLVTDDSAAAGAQRIVVLPFEVDLQQCVDGQTHAAPWSGPNGLSALTPPRKTKHRNPIYPANVLSERVEGAVWLSTVVGTAGCMQQVVVTRSPDPRLDVAALRSVLGWRFSPTLVDGQPVPINVMIEVAFTIRR